jgi:DNA polymerase III epsilon subunit-like protein
MFDANDRRKFVPAVIDVEASGFGTQSYPIEIGYVLPDGTLACFLVRPEVHWIHWDEAASQVHGISRHLLLSVGKPVTQVAQWLNDQLKGMTLYSDSWAHDYFWLATLFEEANLVPLFKLEHFACIIPEEDLGKWDDVRAGIQSELGLQRHRASNDALILQRTWVRLMEH